jgi:hypothetical protein
MQEGWELSCRRRKLPALVMHLCYQACCVELLVYSSIEAQYPPLTVVSNHPHIIGLLASLAPNQRDSELATV